MATLGRWVLRLLRLGLVLGVIGTAALAYALWHYGRDLPDYRQLANYEPPIVTRVYAGNGQLLGFMSGEDVRGYPKEFDAGINRGLGLAQGVYHFAFDAESESDLERIKQHLISHGVEVRGPVDHEGWCKSIYFLDPNGLQLEVCHLSRPLVADDAIPRVRFRREGRQKLGPSGSPSGGPR